MSGPRSKVAKAALSTADFLHFLLDAIDRIHEDTDGITREQYLADTPEARRRRDAVVKNIGQIGDVCADLRTHRPAFVEACQDIPFTKIVAMRNELFHGYYAVDHTIVWNTCKVHVPALEGTVRRILSALEPGAGDASDSPSQTSKSD